LAYRQCGSGDSLGTSHWRHASGTLSAGMKFAFWRWLADTNSRRINHALAPHSFATIARAAAGAARRVLRVERGQGPANGGGDRLLRRLLADADRGDRLQDRRAELWD